MYGFIKDPVLETDLNRHVMAPLSCIAPPSGLLRVSGKLRASPLSSLGDGGAVGDT